MKSVYKYKSCMLSFVVLAIGLTFAFESMAEDVLILGDSMMKSVARELKKACDKSDLTTETFTSIGSGLSRLDLLDWNSETEALIKEHNPKQAIVMMGANDNQTMQGGGVEILFGGPGWDLEYGRRCGKLMDIMVSGGVSNVVWFGLPCMREKKLNEGITVINRIIKQQATARPEVTYISTYRMFSKDGKYSSYIIQKSGMPLDVRSEDGIHFNRNGAKYLVDLVAKKILVK